MTTEQGLFGELPPAEPTKKKLRKSEFMWYMHGKREDKKCGECGHLITEGSEKGPTVYFKCDLYGTSSSEATDWRKKYIACGLWKERE